MRTGNPFRFILLSLFLCGFLSSPVFSQQAQTPDQVYDPLKGNQEIKKLVKAFPEDTNNPSHFEVLKKEITNHLRKGEQGQENIENELQQIDAALKAMGDKVEGESEKIARERNDLAGKRKIKEVELAEYRLLTLNATESLKKLEAYRLEGRRQRMLTQGVPFWELVQGLQSLSDKEKVLDFGQMKKWLILTEHQAMVIVLCILVSIWCCVRLLTKVGRYQVFDKCSSLAILLERANRQPVVARMVLGFLAGATISSWLLLSHEDTHSLFPWIFLSILVVALLPTVAEALCLAGKIPDQVEQTFHAGQRWRIRLAAFGVGLLIFVLSIPDPAVAPETIFLVFRAITIFCVCLLTVLAILSVAHYYSFLTTKRKTLRPILLGVTAVILYLELLGFRELSAYVLASFASSYLLYAGIALFIDMLKYLYTLLYRERRQFFGRIGVSLDQEDESDLLKSIGWLQGFLKGIMILFVVLMLVRIWDVSNAYAGALFSFLLNGFHIGDMFVVPVRIVLGIFVFIVGWSAALWIKKFLEQKWEPDQSFAASTREALLTVTGYVCYVMAALVGLSVAGVSFSGLTVVAGALSVGIGFGMQNIVNNFVSGLILLFERPIKRGDWIVVGSTEGHVKKISVRSTIIQTFDRADVIVPNSELIASPVTNMMFNDARGRLRVSIGVAYGSDTELVRRLLLEIANGHAEVIVDGSSPKPEVFFQAFGDSSLNFDLLCHLKNVDNKYRVLSEINFRIDAAFRLHGIEIPFPQRDIHIKNPV